MIMKNIRHSIISMFSVAMIALLAVTSGCKSSKQSADSSVYSGTETEETLKARFANTVASYNEWTTFKTSGKFTIGGVASFSSSMQLAMVKGKAISISIRPFLGIEMGKLYITEDSIVIVNKMEKYYIAERLQLITNGIPFNINDMQNIFLARMFELGKGGVTTDAETLKSITADAEGLMNVKFEPKNMGFDYLFAVNKDLEVKNLTVSFTGSQSDFFVNYYDYQTSVAGKIADTIEMLSKFGEKDFSLKFVYDSSRNEWNGDVDCSIQINSRYSRVDGEAFFTSFFK